MFVKNLIIGFILLLPFLTNASVGKFAFIKGLVSIERDGSSFAVKKNDLIQKNDIIKIGPSSLAVLSLTNATIKLEENSQIKLDDNQLAYDTNIEIEFGTLVINKIKNHLKNHLKNQIKSKLHIKTKYASMGIRGTTFFVYQGKQPQTTLSVQEGEVEYMAQNSKDLIAVSDNMSVMNNIEIKNLKPRIFGFEKKINFNLDPSKNLNSSDDLKNTIEESWNNYKNEQEHQWNQKKLDENNTWENWKKENS
jgi:hypothetical protein